MALALVALAAVVIYLYHNPKVIKVPVGVPMMPRFMQRPERPPQSPEFREAPIKQYKPGHMQQMGVLTGDGDETLPLYGKEVRGRRDRYHYYTTTGGDNLYSLPINHDGRDCVDDIGFEAHPASHSTRNNGRCCRGKCRLEQPVDLRVQDARSGRSRVDR